jgi:hypothetical protein
VRLAVHRTRFPFGAGDLTVTEPVGVEPELSLTETLSNAALSSPRVTEVAETDRDVNDGTLPTASAASAGPASSAPPPSAAVAAATSVARTSRGLTVFLPE